MNGQKFGLSEHAQGQLHLAGQLILQPFELDWDNGSSVLTPDLHGFIKELPMCDFQRQ